MSKFPNAGEEIAAMERQETMSEKPQDRYAGRHKFKLFCHRCGSRDGMQIVHRDTLTDMTDVEIEILEPWYQLPYEPHYLFYVCPRCNASKIIPDGYESVANVSAWITFESDSMQPDYEVLAAEEPVLASLDSRASAGI